MKKILLSILSLLCAFNLLAQWDKDVFMLRGRTALQDGKFAQAIENFNVLTSLDTTDYWSFFYRGIAKYNLGDIRGAQQDFDASVRLNPVFTNGYHYRAITESRFGQYDEAFADFNKAIELRPGFVGTYFSRGVCYFLAQRFEDAVADFDHYIRREPRDPSAFLNRGASYLFLGDTTRALEDYNRAIRIDRFEPEGYIRRGRVLASQERFEDAIQDMNQAIQLDTSNTFAYFNRALMLYETRDYNAAMRDLDKVLRDDPRNALTLYNRSLILAQVGDYDAALQDIDHVININPGNVLAYYNRAAFFVEMGRYRDALDDYDKAIELYPDFAKAYLNRSYVKNLLGQWQASRRDYETAQRKVREYRARGLSEEEMFADTTRNYNGLLALDADFAKKDFDNELLQHRDVDIRLQPLFKFSLSAQRQTTGAIIERRYENSLLQRFLSEGSTPLELGNRSAEEAAAFLASFTDEGTPSRTHFVRGLRLIRDKQYNNALGELNQAVEEAQNDVERDRYARFYQAFYLMNRGVLKAEMIDFIASIESNVQTLTMDDQGATRARVSDRYDRQYDYSEVIADMEAAAQILPEIPHIFFNLGNLYCLSSQFLESIANYDRAIDRYPYMGEAYFNRGLVLIYLKDKEKGCIDLSRAGELGIKDAYSVIGKYCEEDD